MCFLFQAPPGYLVSVYQPELSLLPRHSCYSMKILLHKWIKWSWIVSWISNTRQYLLGLEVESGSNRCLHLTLGHINVATHSLPGWMHLKASGNLVTVHFIMWLQLELNREKWILASTEHHARDRTVGHCTLKQTVTMVWARECSWIVGGTYPSSLPDTAEATYGEAFSFLNP